MDDFSNLPEDHTEPHDPSPDVPSPDPAPDPAPEDTGEYWGQVAGAWFASQEVDSKYAVEPGDPSAADSIPTTEPGDPRAASDSAPEDTGEYWGQVAGAWFASHEVDSTRAPVPDDSDVIRIRSRVLEPKDKRKRDTALPDDFEALSLAEALGYIARYPVDTIGRLWHVLARDPAMAIPVAAVAADTDYAEVDDQDDYDDHDDFGDDSGFDDGEDIDTAFASLDDDQITSDDVDSDDHTLRIVRAIALLGAIVLAVIGGRDLHTAATDPAAHYAGDTGGALAWFALAGGLVIFAELWMNRAWWAKRLPMFPTGVMPETDSAQVAQVDDMRVASRTTQPVLFDWFETHIFRLAIIPVALIMTSLTYGLNVARDSADRIVNVQITTAGFLVWIAAVALWIVILGVEVKGIRDWSVGAIHESPLQRHRWREGRNLARLWPLLIVGLITLGGLVFRLHELSAVPPEMTSDHIEKLLDGLRVYDGNRSVFFANNGGREGFQMYMVALIAGPLGAGFNFDALKLATVIEGVITLPILWWMTRQIIGTETEAKRRLGNWIGFAVAGLVAVSSWHLMLSRLGLRIVLTPLTTALVIGFLARAMRYNRMRDFLALGFTLGAGTYFYQANRMLPLLVIAGIALVVLAQMRRWADVLHVLGRAGAVTLITLLPLGLLAGISRLLAADGAGWLLMLAALLWFSVVALAARAFDDPTLRYIGGLLAAGVIALALYVPMFHYSELYPDQFWNRTRGRMFGDEAFLRTDPETGLHVSYEPSLSEQFDLFWDQRATFFDNFEDALKMYHWEGDSAWINNAHGAPALDAIAGGLVVLGAVIWGLWMIRAARRRDRLDAVVLLLLPGSILIMLLPSAMTLAYTIENPSFTRASGTIPPVFVLAALPVGLLAFTLARWQIERIPVGQMVALGGLAILIGLGIGPNEQNFFTDYRLSYSNSWKPYHEIAQPLRAFAQSEGSYGNGFMVAYPHWLDHRILGAMAGDLRWPNGLVNRDDLFEQMRLNQGTRYQYDPSKPIFVMYHLDDSETATYLDTILPGGTHTRYDYRYETLTPGHFDTGAFVIFTVMAGEIDLAAF